MTGRLRYSGSDEWSEAASSLRPGDRVPRTGGRPEEAGSSIILPIAVGAVVAVVLLALVIVLIVRRAR